MQTSRFSSFPTVHSSFKRHRSSIDHPSFPLNLTLSKPTTSPVWGSLPTPPMSGSPPPEHPRDPSQLAGRRRKRSNTPIGTTTGPANTVPSLVERTPYPYGESQLGQRREEPSMQVATQSFPYLPPLTYGAGIGLSTASYHGPELSGPQSQTSPRSTRKTKAHVASACINCKKKHLRCDNSRPCRRCVQGGKEDTCQDVEHKKRGRPPLKPEDPSSAGRTRGHGPTLPTSFPDSSNIPYGSESRGFPPSVYPPILPSAQSSGYTHGRSSSRSSAYSTVIQSPYAVASIAPSPLGAMGSGFTYGQRPISTSSSMSGVLPPSFGSQVSPMGQEQYPRQTSLYSSNYVYPGFQMEPSPSNQPYYQSPMYPREPQQPVVSQSESQSGPYGSTGLQLPPIRPATYVTPLEPAFMPHPRQATLSQQPQQQQYISQGAQSSSTSADGREPDSKRPKMDIQGILGPRQD